METNKFTRRQALQATAVLGTALLLPVIQINAAALPPGQTPPLTADEIAAIDTALGKKGSYKDAEQVYTTPLPRNDLKMRIKGEPYRSLLVSAAGYRLRKRLMVNPLWS
jgi:hypothetical protein